jgi:RHS repeat-associated protein
MSRLLAGILLLLATAAHAQTEIVLDNTAPAFAVTGTWPAGTSVTGYIGANYQSHAPNGAPPGAIVVDNTDAGFSATGTWPASTSVAGYAGANYQVHEANGVPPTALVADNSSGTATGTWPTSTSVAGYYGTNYQPHAAGTGTETFTWTLNVAAAGTYEVYARWSAHPNRASDAKYTVSHAGGQDTVSVNQQANSATWQLLGTYSFNAGATTISLSDQANGYVIADAVMLAPPGAAPSTATWSMNVPSSASYAVYARWSAHPNRASDAKFTINHAAGSTQVTANMEVGGGTWNLLGTYGFNAGASTVTLTDQANGYVIADAVMLLPPGSAPNSAIWTPNVAQGGQYEVYARWTASANRASNATYTVTHANGATAVAVNQQTNGGAWNLLGTFTLASGTAHNVTLTDQANGYVIADAIRLVPVAVQAELKLYFVHADHLNTPRAVYDDQQQLRWKWDQQEPFGNNIPDENPDGLGTFEFPFRFPGQYADRENGLAQNALREYSAEFGRYLQSDPLGLVGGTETYSYVAGSPIRYTDPTGELSIAACANPVNAPACIAAGIIAGPVASSIIAAGVNAAIQQLTNGCIDPTQVIDVAGDAAHLGMLLGPLGGMRGFLPAVRNPVPQTLARVIPGKGPFPTLGPPSRSDVFVTAADDIAGLTASQISKRLGIPPSNTFTVVQFPTPKSGLASPVNRTDPGFVGRGRTSGGAREFVVPNGSVPPNAVIKVIGP